MIRLRRWSVPILPVLLAPALRAQDKPPAPDKPVSPWAIDRSLTVSPQGPPVPALKYRLLPLSSELKEGNAVPIYLRLVHEQNDAARKYWTETPKPWNVMPVDKMPLDEARKFLQDHHYLLRQFELGARRRTAEWDYTLDEPNPIGLLLPDMQWMRNYSPMLILQARVAIAEGDFTAAAHHLETGFAFSRHVAEGPTLIHSLVAIALARDFASTVADFVERPDAPNLYWALTALPRPLIDLRRAQEWEYRMLEMQFPELDDLDRERTAEQWDGVLRRLRTELRGLALLPSEGGKRKLPDWFPKDYAPEDPAAKSPDLPAARKFVARTKGLLGGQGRGDAAGSGAAPLHGGHISRGSRRILPGRVPALPAGPPPVRCRGQAAPRCADFRGTRAGTLFLPALTRVMSSTGPGRAQLGRPASHRGLADVCRRPRRPAAGQAGRRDRGSHSQRSRYRPAVRVPSRRRHGDAGQPGSRRPATQ